MNFKKLGLVSVFAIPVVISGCSTIDNIFGGSSGSSDNVATSQVTPAQPSQPQPAPEPSSTQSETKPNKKTGTSLVVYLSSKSNADGYTLVEQKGQKTYVDPRHTLLRSDLDNVLAVRDDKNNSLLNLHFSPSGKKKLEGLTQQNTGKTLTVTYKGELLSIIDITSPIKEGVLSVPMPSPEKAGKLEQQILDGD